MATIVDNIPYFPEASPILQVSATDADIGINGQVFYELRGGNEDQLFRMDNTSGILYPAASFLGHKGEVFNLLVEVRDEAGAATWPNPATARMSVVVESVNTFKPRWNPPPPPNETVTVQVSSISKNLTEIQCPNKLDFGKV